jgi:hypothetical protein
MTTMIHHAQVVVRHSEMIIQPCRERDPYHDKGAQVYLSKIVVAHHAVSQGQLRS